MSENTTTTQPTQKKRRGGVAYTGPVIAVDVSDDVLNTFVRRHFVEVKDESTGETLPKLRLYPKNFAEYKTFCEYKARIAEAQARGWRRNAEKIKAVGGDKTQVRKVERAKRAYEQLLAMHKELAASNPNFDAQRDLGIDLNKLAGLFGM